MKMINTLTYVVNHENWPPTSLIFTFSADPGYITLSDIVFCHNVSTGGATLTGSGSIRTVTGVSINGRGLIDVSIPSVYNVDYRTYTIGLIPPPPEDITILSVSASTVDICWEPLDLTTDYQFLWYKQGVYQFTSVMSNPRYTRHSLQHNMAYSFRILASNDAGHSNWGELFTFNTLNNNTSNVIAISPNSIVVEWPRDSNYDYWSILINEIFNLAIYFFEQVLGLDLPYDSPISHSFSYQIYRDDSLLAEIDIPSRIVLTPIPPYFHLVQDSHFLDHYYIDTDLIPNTTYNYKVYYQGRLDFLGYDFSEGSLHPVLIESATTWSSLTRR